VLYEFSFFEPLVELVDVFVVAERAGTYQSVAADTPSVLASYLQNRVVAEFFERIFACLHAVVLGERV
jgi:hypothetical protein